MNDNTPPPSGNCPQCSNPRIGGEKNPAFPFCSHRCKMVDLGRWLNGEYRIPLMSGVTERTDPSADEVEAANNRDMFN
jgi:uncharacterized protein